MARRRKREFFAACDNSCAMRILASNVIRQMKVPAAILVLVGAFVGAIKGQSQDADAVAPETLTGHWKPRMRLEEKGVQPFASLTSEAWGNTTGGLKVGAWYDQLLDFGFQLDTAKLGWWEGGGFFVQAHWVEHAGNASCFEDDTGAFNPVSNVMAGDQLRIFNLYYRHAWKDAMFQLKLGQIAADDDFMGSDYSKLFLNSAFGAMPSQVGTPLATSCGSTPAFPIYSVAAPGIFLRAQPVEPFYTQLGLYYGRLGLDKPGNHGFDWASETPPELGLFWENGFHYKLADCPATIRLGLTYHTGPLDDFSSATRNGSTATHQAVPNYYAIHDLQLLADEKGQPKLGLFCRGGITPEPELSMVSWYADTGLNWFAPLPDRTDDLAGIAVSYTKFGSAFREKTGPDGVAADETTLELTYRAVITHWWTMQADTQFLFNPAVNPNTNSRRTAIVLGLRAVITF